MLPQAKALIHRAETELGEEILHDNSSIAKSLPSQVHSSPYDFNSYILPLFTPGRVFSCRLHTSSISL